MTLTTIILTTIACLGLSALIVCALIGAMAMGHVISTNRRPWDDQPPPRSWLAKQERGE